MLMDGIDKQNYISNRMPMPVDVVADSAYGRTISGEIVQLYYWSGTTLTQDAGQVAGTVVIAVLKYRGVLDLAGAMLGNDGETSLVWTTNTVLPAANRKPCKYLEIESPKNKTLKEVAVAVTADFATGEWCLDHRNGVIYGKKATAGTSDTATYKINSTQVNAVLETGDLEIGAVEIKNASTDDRADVSDANTARTTGTHVIATQTIDAAGNVLGRTAANTARTTGTLVDPVQIVDAAGNVINVTAANTARTTATLTLPTQPIDEAGLVLGRDAANTARTVATKVNPMQQIGADGTVPPTGSLNTNAPFSKLTDGTSNLALGTGTTKTVPAELNDGTTKIVFGTGTIKNIPVGLNDGTTAVIFGTGTVKTVPCAINDGTTTAVIETDGTKKALDVNITDGTNDMPTMDAVARKGFVAITDGTSTVDVAVDDSAMPATPKTIPVSAEYRSVDTAYADGDVTVLQSTIAGHLKTRADGYDTATDSMKQFEVSPLDQHYVEESLVDTTNLAAAAAYYPASTGALVGAYKDFSFTGKFIEGAGETITMLVQGMNDEDTASGDWITVYGYRDDANSTVASVVATNATVTYSWSFNNFNYKYYRIVVTPDSATNTAIVKLRKKAL